jgi:hypothetical protein
VLAEEIPFAKFQLYEAMIGIALNAGALIATNQIFIEDSRELVQTIVRLAMEFEVKPRGRETETILFT